MRCLLVFVLTISMFSLTGCQVLDVLGLREELQETAPELSAELMIVANSYNEFKELKGSDNIELEAFLTYLGETQDMELEMQELLELFEGLPGFESIDGIVANVASINGVLIATLNDLGDIMVSLDKDSMTGLQDFTRLAQQITNRAPEIQKGLFETAEYLNGLRKALSDKAKDE